MAVSDAAISLSVMQGQICLIYVTTPSLLRSTQFLRHCMNGDTCSDVETRSVRYFPPCGTALRWTVSKIKQDGCAVFQILFFHSTVWRKVRDLMKDDRYYYVNWFVNKIFIYLFIYYWLLNFSKVALYMTYICSELISMC